MFERLLHYVDRQDQKAMDAINQLKQVIAELNTKLETYKVDAETKFNDLVKKHAMEKAQIEADIMLQLNALKDFKEKM